MYMKINYTHYEQFIEKYRSALEEIKNGVESYLLKIKDITNDGIISGSIHDELLIYIEHVQKVPDYIDDINGKLENLITKYLEDMNAAQCIDGEYILYPENYSKTRDYTDENFEKMKILCDSSDHDANVFQEINDWGEDIVAEAINFVGNTFDWLSIRQTQKFVMETNDITRKRLKEIQRRLKEQEDIYSAKVSELHTCLENLSQYINILREAVSTGVVGFSMEGFTPKLNTLYGTMVTTLSVLDFDEVVVNEDVEKFIAEEKVEGYFDDTSALIYAYLAELSTMEWKDGDFWKIIITQQFDIASQRLRYLFSDDYEYSDFVLDKQTMELINEITEAQTFEESTEKEILDTYKTYMKYIDKFGDEWEEKLEGVRDENGKLILDKRTNKYKIFKETFDQFGRAEKILSYGTDLCEIVAKLCADYEKNLAILDSLEKNCNASDTMLASLQRIRNEYEKSIGSIALNVYDKVSQYGVDFVMSNADKLLKVSVFMVVGVIEMGIDIGGNITGISSEAAAMSELFAVGYNQMNSAKSAYANAIAAVKACSPDNEEYDGLLEDMKNCFDYYKITQKRMFEKMATASTGIKKDYYNYCAEELNNLSLNNYENFNLMSYEEYQTL